MKIETASGMLGLARPWCLAVLLGITATRLGAAPAAPNFNLLDLQGRNHQLQRADRRVVVLFFTGVGCPIARKSAPKLREIRDRFESQGVAVWIINTYPDDKAEDAWKEIHEFGLQGFPYLMDPKQGVALALGVERTAEVVAIEPERGRVIYQGAIDDQFSEGSELPEARERHLENALTRFLADQPVTVRRTAARGCRVAFAPASAPDPATDSTYNEVIAPMLRKHCSECHREGGIGPWALDGHARVRNYSRMIEEVLLERRMPPWDADPHYGRFANAQVLTREDTQALLRWIHAGAPRGIGPDPLAEPLPPLDDWPLGTPDVVLQLPETQTIPATGVLDYRHIRVASPFTNDVWISGADIRPGNRRVVHHVILYAKWPGCRDDGTGNGTFVCGWAPGTPPIRLPAGAAKRLPAGAELTMEVHYTTCGSEQTDQSSIALYLAPGPQPLEVEVRAAVETDVNIPPGSDEARHTASYAFRKPAVLFSLSPHMHVRGKWMRYELLLPNGERETLLHVPRFDFKWQWTYVLDKPRTVPAGAWLLVTGAFDNGAANPGNPDPARRVHFGPQSWDEMFIGFFEAADLPEDGRLPEALLSSTTR